MKYIKTYEICEKYMKLISKPMSNKISILINDYHTIVAKRLLMKQSKLNRVYLEKLYKLYLNLRKTVGVKKVWLVDR